jgi:hypothetical protein
MGGWNEGSELDQGLTTFFQRRSDRPQLVSSDWLK